MDDYPQELHKTPEHDNDRKVDAYTAASEKHPENNEDSFITLQRKGVYGVFDGMGGLSAGDEASAQAARTVSRYFETHTVTTNRILVEDMLVEAALEAHAAVRKDLFDVEAGTTAAFAQVYMSENEGVMLASILSSGDSRVYLMQAGVLECLTVDHNASRRDMGEDFAAEQQRRLDEYTGTVGFASQNDEQAFGSRNEIGGALKSDDTTLDYDVNTFEVFPGDTLLFTTDGIHDNLTRTEIEAIMVSIPGEVPVAQKLVARARERANENHRRSKKDDMTAVIVKI